MSSTDSTPSPPKTEPEVPWLERSVGGLLRLLGGTAATFLRLFYLPWQAPLVARDPKPLAPPLSFLIVALLVTGIATETYLLYDEQSADASVVEMLTQAIGELGPQEVTLLTVPVVGLVVALAIFTAWWSVKGPRGFDQPVVRGVCYAAGVQLLIVACFLLGLFASRVIRGHDRVASKFFDNGPLLCLIGVVFGSAVWQVERVVKHCGNTWFARHLITRLGIATSTAGTIFIGTCVVAWITFDVGKTIAELEERERREYFTEFVQETEENFSLVVSLVESRMVGQDKDHVRFEQTVALTNATETALIVLRPEELQPAPLMAEFCPRSTVVSECSLDGQGDVGWVLSPGETRLAEWTLDVPTSATQRSAAALELEFRDIDTERWLKLESEACSEPMVATFFFQWSEPLAVEPEPTVVR